MLLPQLKKFLPTRKFQLILALLIAVLFITLNSSLITLTHAQSADDLAKQLEEKRNEIEKVQEQLATTQKQEKTLKSQLEIIDTQNKVTELKIEETALKVQKLEREITDLSGRIGRISGSVDHLSQVLLDRIVKTYKGGNISTLELVFSSNSFSELLERIKYLQIAQANDKKVLYELQATKAAYNDQKQDKETRQKEAEILTKQLEDYQTQLAQQKVAKQELLSVTKNDEARFQSLIAQLKADQDSITRALSNVGLVIGPVKKGQVIGAEGLTGCTSGPHLHFEMYENAKVENGHVVGNRINPHNVLDNGTVGPPMQGYPGSTHISTEYGEVYALGTHTGLDIYDDASVGTPLLAVFDGTAYAVGDSGCRVSGFSHGPAKGIVIDNGAGLVALYWHLM